MGILNPSELETFDIINSGVKAPLVLACDHASNTIPASLNNLGLAPANLQGHIAWDIGAAAVTRRLSEILQAPAILARFSRLVIDLNRDPNDPASIPIVSDQTTIPGNQNLAAPERASRKQDLYDPYHERLADLLSHQCSAGVSPGLISIHTFTPHMTGEARPWHIGVLWNRDPRIAEPLIETLEHPSHNLVVGDNKPYSGKQYAHTLDIHAGAYGYANCAIEIRQDLVQSEDQVHGWANLLAGIITVILNDPDVLRTRYY